MAVRSQMDHHRASVADVSMDTTFLHEEGTAGTGHNAEDMIHDLEVLKMM